MDQELNILACQIDIPSMQTSHDRDQHLENSAHKMQSRLQKEVFDLVVLPELSSIDYSQSAFENLDEIAEPLKGASFERYREIAVEFGVAIVYGIARKHKGDIKISQVVLGPRGELLGYFDKLHIANFGFSFEKKYFKPGEHLFVFEHKGIKIAPIICYDIRMPELIRTLALKHDVQLVLHCGAYGRDESFYSWHYFVVTRALENQLYILSLNRAGKQFGNSLFCPPWVDETAPGINFPDFEETMLAIKVEPKEISRVRNRYSFLADKFDDYNLLKPLS